MPKARPYPRVDYTHSTVRLLRIAKDNQLLLSRLMHISSKEPVQSVDALTGVHASPGVASSAVNRRRAAAAIAQARLGGIAPLLHTQSNKDSDAHTHA